MQGANCNTVNLRTGIINKCNSNVLSSQLIEKNILEEKHEVITFNNNSNNNENTEKSVQETQYLNNSDENIFVKQKNYKKCRIYNNTNASFPIHNNNNNKNNNNNNNNSSNNDSYNNDNNDNSLASTATTPNSTIFFCINDFFGCSCLRIRSKFKTRTKRQQLKQFNKQSLNLNFNITNFNFKIKNLFLWTLKCQFLTNILRVFFALYLANSLFLVCDSSSVKNNFLQKKPSDIFINNYYNLTDKYHTNSVYKRDISYNRAVLHNSKGQVICSSIDVRNDYEEITKHKNCSIIEGFLTITNLELKDDVEKYAFPKLTEITDFLMVYRFKGLKSLSSIFPNLTVIRGTILFEQFALIIFENINLVDIGLYSLSRIKRGAVRIANNADLCFVDTINWTNIVANNENNFIWENKDKRDCPKCPRGPNATEGIFEKEPADCSNTGCWNHFYCERICPSACPNNCLNEKVCCNSECMGCRETPNQCISCRDFVEDHKCTKSCKPKFLKYSDRSCITTEACYTKQKYQNEQVQMAAVSEEACVIDCPHGYKKLSVKTETVPVGRYCEKCKKGDCEEQCEGGPVDSLADAKKFRGCSNVTTDLIINLRQGGKHLMEELEDSFESIRIIHTTLQVVRSFALPSLGFFKNLREISGVGVLPDSYSFYVLENSNLQDIWGENQTVEIKGGRIFFHFNEKLCYYKIEALRKHMYYNEPFQATEVSNTTNGNRGSCNMTVLSTQVDKVDVKGAVIHVLNPIKYSDPRSLISYQYYLIEAPDVSKNISKYDYRSSCGNDAWTIYDRTKEPFDTFLFNPLKPYTRYAYYVRTETIADQPNGESKIDYFMSAPGQPDQVRNLRVINTTINSLEIEWLAPNKPNGILVLYEIKLKLLVDHPLRSEERCNHTDINEVYYDTVQPSRNNIEDSCSHCTCDIQQESQKSSKKGPEFVEDDIHFENALQNFIFVKKVNETPVHSNAIINRNRRAIAEEEFPKKIFTDKKYDSTGKQNLWHNNTTGTFYVQFYKEVAANVTKFTVNNLRHFGVYKIEIIACREGKIEHNCSDPNSREAKTDFKKDSDFVRDLQVESERSNNTGVTVLRISWLPPEDANGLVLYYTVHSRKVDFENEEPISRCVYMENLIVNNISNRLTYKDKFSAGRYEIKVKANTRIPRHLRKFSEPVYITVYPGSLQVIEIVGIVIGILISLGIFGLILLYVKRKYYAQQPDLKLITSVNPEYVSMQYTPDEWELQREQIIQLRELGQGSFGMVYEGVIKNYNQLQDNTPCAIKTVNESATDGERIKFLEEAHRMKQLSTHHVVRLLGVVSRGQPTLVVMELMSNGDLKAFLRRHRPDPENFREGQPLPQPPTLRKTLQMAIEIADGMSYLSAKKFVHRDLAARNCMVAQDLTVKIGDFGMTRDIYETDYYRKGTKGLLPVRWMAPESLKDGVFTSASDVFSYGIVLWEMATLASQPYQGLSNDQVLRYVIDGGVMERPENCPDILYNLMVKCWQHRPSLRPTFFEIIEILLEDADRHFADVSFYHSPEGKEIREQMHSVADLDDVTTPLRLGFNTSMEQPDSIIDDNESHSPFR
ncbi:insulin-like receptor [Condylostylus longicornis]|uniref:insulin-like receptor n=1 Tax=Condylostylus longicornis TaxID=2530218 RepID=UPI00244E2062|nr:insulin-like receptor [Condylostylus longicornis]XP_055384772.1 insulin-like receptor [Condylostylus longicornis]